MNKAQRWHYEDLQKYCDEIAAMGQVLVDFADSTLCDADPENVQDSDMQRAEKILGHLTQIFTDESLQAHCRKIGLDTAPDWAGMHDNLPGLLNKTKA